MDIIGRIYSLVHLEGMQSTHFSQYAMLPTTCLAAAIKIHQRNNSHKEVVRGGLCL